MVNTWSRKSTIGPSGELEGENDSILPNFCHGGTYYLARHRGRSERVRQELVDIPSPLSLLFVHYVQVLTRWPRWFDPPRLAPRAGAGLFLAHISDLRSVLAPRKYPPKTYRTKTASHFQGYAVRNGVTLSDK